MTDSYRKEPGRVSQLTPRQYEVTQEGATEPAFDNEFLGQERGGYLCRRGIGRTSLCLQQKFDSGCGVAESTPYRSNRETSWRRRIGATG